MADAIKTERLILRPYRVADGAILISAFNDFEIVRWLSRPPYPFKESDLRLTNNDGSSRWPDVAAIEFKGNMIGSISNFPHLGYWLLRDFWGKGFATEAALAMVKQFFRPLQNSRMVSGYFEGNVTSARVLHKVGFTETERSLHHCQPQRKNLPYVGLELTRDRWEAMQ